MGMKIFERSEKFLAGCGALGGRPVKEISEEIGMSREYVYQQKEKIIQYAELLDDAEPEVLTLRLDKRNIERMILSLTFDCQSPQSGIQSFFETVCGKQISTGYISGVIKEAAKRAQVFDDQINLSGICQGANDEIFQCGVPILTGIDPESTYTYLLEEASDRTAETWATYLDDRKEHGLDLEISINDGGTGLMAGIPQVFPDVEIQADTFHAVYDMGKEVAKLERSAYKLMKVEYALAENLSGKRPRAKNKVVLEEIQPKVVTMTNLYDMIYILYTWLKELLSFSGYSMEDTMLLTKWILQEMDELTADNPSIRTEVGKVQKMLPSLLSFIGRLEQGIETVAQETGIPIEAFRLMYYQMSCKPGSLPDIEIQCKLALLLKERYIEATDAFEKLLNRIKKASSLVENLNGRIRVFIEVKRVIPTRFFILLKVYFNTHRYKRSRCKERIGKSPLELLTGSPQPEFLAALGY
jgi:Mg2+ and Co2+ transporter CorA